MRVSQSISAILATAALAVDVVTFEANVDLDYAYSSYLTKYGMAYDTVQEYTERKERFAIVDAQIREHNSRNDSSYTVGHNKFSDWTQQEWDKLLSYRTTATVESTEGEKEATIVGKSAKVGAVKTFSTDIPASVDWRDAGAVTSVQDQGGCGACWAFMAAGALEGAYKIAGGDLYNLSEQQIADCTTSAQGGTGCTGGYIYSGFSYLMTTQAIKDEDYPYTSGVSKAVGTCQAADKPHLDVSVLTWNSVKTLSGPQLKAAVATGPVGVAINANFWVQMYKEGIFNPTSSTCPNTVSDMNHTVILVGYGSTDGTDYFILKNSWGTTWGEAGYMRIQYTETGNGVCGIYTGPVIPTSNNGASALSCFFAATVAALTLAF